ncbi:PREDICTED: zinc finger protein 64 homolog, isoforms 1 and 2-like [Propithecus coquereli]|uniref:ZFP64 zinc finger protein n=1 Tax=Propithecus coquereli TaxID=379532 RepID=A0A2K6FF57_PROCO|nr:PREDICTED: zinc finger protein 64 homolog, isoforms 1 and 2-like [Propithecus coquereli]
MNASGEGESFPGSVQIPGGTTVLVELTPDIHICGICKQQFNNLDAFVAHKQSGCQLTSTSGAAPSTVQFVSEETVPATQTQTTTRTITSETQTITVSAPEFVFEHGYQTYLPTESNENQTATVISLPAKSRTKKPATPPAQKRLNCCYPGCQFKTAYGMKDMERHLKIHTGDAPFQCWLCSAKFKISSDLKRHMRVHSGEKPFKCEFCNVRCTMKGNLKSHIRIKHSGNNFKCPHCDFLGDSKATLRKHSRVHQSEHPEKCSECSYSCSSKAALRIHARIHCTDRPFKCGYCSFDTKQPSNLSKHMKKFHGDMVKTEALERKDTSRQSSRQVAKLDAKKTFHCDICEASFMREDSLRSHKRQHSEYSESKSSDVTVLQFQIDPSKQPAAPLTVGHLQVPLQPSQVPQFGEGRVKIIVGHQVPQANTIVQAAAAAVNIVPPALVAQNPEELPGGGRLQILRQVSLIAPPQSSGCPSEAGAMTQPAVLLTAHDQTDGAALHQTLIPTAPGGPQEGSGNQTFIASSGITCTDFEGLNALIQEGAAEVTVVSDGGQNIAVATTAPPIFSSSSQQELPKQTFSIIQGAAHPALLCPADSIPD